MPLSIRAPVIICEQEFIHSNNGINTKNSNTFMYRKCYSWDIDKGVNLTPVLENIFTCYRRTILLYLRYSAVFQQATNFEGNLNMKPESVIFYTMNRWAITCCVWTRALLITTAPFGQHGLTLISTWFGWTSLFRHFWQSKCSDQ